MSGVTALVDTLLATRLAQRVDLVPLKPQVEIAGPVAATRAEKTVNDVRLPSRAALEQFGVDLSGGRKDTPGARSPASAGVTLSAVARAISAILDPQMGPALKIRSPEPLWPQSRAPVAQLLTARLVQAVGNSGLFYESHLQQFATGLRSLEQIAREPQAALALPLLLAASTDTAVAPLVAAKPAAGLGPGAGPVTALFAAGPGSDAQAVRSGPVPLAVVYGRDGKPGKSLPPLREIAGAAADAKAPVAGPVGDKDSSSAVAAAIHPDAIGLVRQQLELLSIPVFRWSGEAWPGTPMDWDIKEEPKEEPTEDSTPFDGEVQPPAWTTNLTLTLPTLKSVQVRLTLAGNTLLVRLASDEDTTLAAFDEARLSLAARFDTLGLQLANLQVSRTDADDVPGQPE